MSGVVGGSRITGTGQFARTTIAGLIKSFKTLINNVVSRPAVFMEVFLDLPSDYLDVGGEGTKHWRGLCDTRRGSRREVHCETREEASEEWLDSRPYVIPRRLRVSGLPIRVLVLANRVHESPIDYKGKF